jgi:hypothetical protein
MGSDQRADVSGQDPAGPADPATPAGAAGPPGEVMPAGPVASAGSAGPVASVGPVASAGPVGSVASAGSVEAARSAGAATPLGSAGSAEAARSAGAATPLGRAVQVGQAGATGQAGGAILGGSPELRSGFQGFWTHPATVVGAVGIMLLMVTALAMLALRRDSSAAGQTVAGEGGSAPSASATPNSSGPLLPMTPAVPGSGNGQAAGNSTGGNGKAPDGDGTTDGSTPTKALKPGAVFAKGTVALTTSSSQNAVDLDVAQAGGLVGTETDTKPEAVLTKKLIRAKGAASLAVWQGSSAPSRTQCLAISAGDRTDTVLAEQVSTGASLCLQTSEGRPGVLTFTSVETKGGSGKLESIRFTYTIWEA